MSRDLYIPPCPQARERGQERGRDSRRSYDRRLSPRESTECAASARANLTLVRVASTRARDDGAMPTSAYPYLLLAHLFGAIAFAGTVFFEVVILEGVRRHVPERVMTLVEGGIGKRARQVIPWVLLLLYGSGLGMAWHHRAALAEPFAGSFNLLLTLKITLALSVFGHFLLAMALRRRQRPVADAYRRIHYSVFAHVMLIVLLAKAMFYLHW